MAELPCWGARGSAKRRRFALLSVFPWFSGLFSKHRSRMIVILKPLRSYLRYGRNGSCFVGFRGRLTLQTCQNVEGYHRKRLTGTLQGVPCPRGWPWGVGHHMDDLCACGSRLWPSPIGRAPLLGG